MGVNRVELSRVAVKCPKRWTSGAADIEAYLAAQVSDVSHRQVIGPLVSATGTSGVVQVEGNEVASWGDPDVPEMAFSATKTVVSVVAGCAFDDGPLMLDQPVHEVVAIPEFDGPPHHGLITWRRLLQQTSQWEGELWGKPTSADAHEGSNVTRTFLRRGCSEVKERCPLTAPVLMMKFGFCVFERSTQHP